MNAAPWPPERDAEAVAFAEWLTREKYSGHVDNLGWFRWGSDWRIHRANNAADPEARRRVSVNIDEIRAGQPTTVWVAGPYDQPWAPELDKEVDPIAKKVEQLYVDNGRVLDDHGRVRWYSDYRLHRANGYAPDTAYLKIEKDIKQAWGIVDPVPPSTIAFPLKVRGLAMTDAHDQPVIPTACHDGEAFSSYVHCKLGTHKKGWTLDQWREQRRKIAEYYPIIRTWFMLGYYDVNKDTGQPAWWHGKNVSHCDFNSMGAERYDWPKTKATPNYLEHVVEFYKECGALGLTVMDDRGDMNSISDTTKYEHMRLRGQALNQAFGKDHAMKLIAGLWAINEASINGVIDPQVACQMINAFKQGAGWLPNICGLSDFNQSEDPEMVKVWSQAPATVGTCHPLRDPGQVKRMLEHYWTNGYYRKISGMKKPLWYTEPIGPGAGVTVGQIEDIEYLCALALNSVIGGSQYTVMSSHGVFWEGEIMDQPSLKEIPTVMKLLQTDVMHFDTIIHAGTANAGTRILAANDSIESRFDQAIDSKTGRFAGMAYAKQGVRPMAVERRFEGSIYHPSTGVSEWAGTANVGQMLPLGGKIARLVVGQLL